MKPIIFITFLFLIASCKGLSSSDKKYFEDVTGVKMPLKNDVIEHYDNVEFLTGVTLEVEHVSLTRFIKGNNLEKSKNNRHYTGLFGRSFLKLDKPLEEGDDNTYFLYGEKQKGLRWMLVADIKRNLLWIEVNYPDWAGN